MPHKKYEIHASALDTPELLVEVCHAGQSCSRNVQGAGVIPRTACSTQGTVTAVFYEGLKLLGSCKGSK